MDVPQSALAGKASVPPLNVRAVLFDLDNTLVDFMRMKRVASDAAARAMMAAGADFPFSALEAGDILFGEYLADIEGDQVFEAFLRRHHRRALGMGQHQVDRITAAAVNAYLKAKMLHMEPYAGVRPTLVALTKAGLRLGVLTDAPRFKAYQRLDAAGLVDFFEFVVTFTDHGERKPHERPFRTALDLLGLPPHQVLMVGDWPEKDMAGAQAVGMRTAWARYGKPGAQVPLEAEMVLDRVEELITRIPMAASSR
ncbi:MAG TPA: HAD-IA family hydrolase [Candidatus Thermoplasmatota archaeon]|nr:HAD-IA family hydrolase [Candidatus Thermoplasmatota archaeon]